MACLLRKYCAPAGVFVIFFLCSAESGDAGDITAGGIMAGGNRWATRRAARCAGSAASAAPNNDGASAASRAW